MRHTSHSPVLWASGLYLFFSVAYALPQQHVSKPFPDPWWDFTMIKNYAAIGDSFAAGIGVGDLRPEASAKDCSRYTGAYPLKIQEAVQAKDFQFTACSGDVSKEIKEQAKKLKRGLNLVTVSAGGNDAGFSEVLKRCIFLPGSAEGCDKALQDADDTISDPDKLEKSVTELIDTIHPLLRKPQGFIAWNLYAPFFDEAPEGCKGQQWCFLSGCQKVDLPLRKRMNELVTKINKKLVDTFDKWNKKDLEQVYPVNWGYYVKLLDGGFCEPDSDGDPKDPSNAKMAFLRPNISPHGDVDGRDVSSLGNATEQAELMARDTAGIVPDDVLKFFHPNDLGTSIQASAALGVIISAIHKRTIRPDTPTPKMCAIPAEPKHDEPDHDDDPPKKTKTLAIAADFMTAPKSLDDMKDYNQLHWMYVQADYGKGAQCRTDTVYDEWREIDRTKAVTYYPSGIKKMKLFGKDCEYRNNGKTAGRLFCGDQQIECLNDPADKDPSDVDAEKGNYKCGDTTRQPVFICSW
ncbi:SGNH hydrolase-type esterase domain-containing protein [Lophiotrema nucula]|uniref:SGNH hydrolase-type esterase domain-containing protein n=1 Tax=Lophiotrema nucula TaxID=690887 RepID=A0A6A5YI08_9PLEO|nr:SGNH hydrolase-type esterase domain-containing protein [Lophiotrema nucula]